MNGLNMPIKNKTGVRLIAVILLTLGVALAACGWMGLNQTQYFAGRAQLSEEEWIDYSLGRRTVEPLTEQDYKGTNLNASGRAKNRVTRLLDQQTGFDRFVMPNRIILLAVGGAMALAGLVMLTITGGIMALAAALTGLLLGVFFLLPMLNLLRLSFSGGDALAALFSQRYYFLALWQSLALSLAATALASLLGIALRLLFAETRIYGGRVMQFLLLTAAMLSPAIGAYAWHLLLPSFTGFFACVAAMALQHFGLVFLLQRKVPQLNERGRLSTLALGQSPAFHLAVLLVFLRTFTDYGTCRLLGGGYVTLPVLIGELYTAGKWNPAALLSVLSLIVTTAVFLLCLYLGFRKNAGLPQRRETSNSWLFPGEKVLTHIFFLLLTLLALAPVFVMLFHSIRENGAFTLAPYTRLWQTITPLLIRTGWMTGVCLICSAFLGWLVACLGRNKYVPLEKAALSPFFAQGLILSVALMMLYSKRPVQLSGNAFLLLAGETLLFFPIALHFSAARIGSYEEILPASGFRMPGAVRGAFAGAVLGAVLMLNGLAAPLFLTEGEPVLLPHLIYQEILQGNRETAAALSCGLAVVTMLLLGVFLILNRKPRNRHSGVTINEKI